MAETITCANCGTQLPGEARFCASCGATIDAGVSPPDATEHLDVPRSDHLTGDNPGVDHPGQEQSSPDLDDPDATTQERRGVRVGLLVAILAVIAIGIGGAIAVSGGIGGGGQVDFIAVFEPERDGYGDLHWVRPGQELTRDTIIAQDIQLSDQVTFWEVSSSTQTRLDHFSLQLDSHSVFAYTQEDDPEEVVIAAIVDGDILELIREESVSIQTYLYPDPDIVHAHVYTESGRCEVYRLDLERTRRIARGDSCGSFSQGHLLIGDDGERGDQRVCEWTYVSTDGDEIDLPPTDSCSHTARMTARPGLIGVAYDARTEAVIYDTSGNEVEEIRGDDLWIFAGPDFLWLHDGFGQDDDTTTWLVGADGSRSEVEAEGLTISPDGEDLVTIDYDDEEVRLSWTTTSELDPTEVLELDWRGPGDTSDRRGSTNWVASSLLFSAGKKVWLVDAESALEIREFEDLTISTLHDSEVSGAVLRTVHLIAGQVRLARLTPDGEVTWLTDDWSTLGYPAESSFSESFVVVSGREDPDDDPKLMLVDLTGTQRPIEIDETEYWFRNVSFIGDEIYYSVKVGDDEDDWEVRRANLSEPTRPEVVYKDGYAIIPDPA